MAILRSSPKFLKYLKKALKKTRFKILIVNNLKLVFFENKSLLKNLDLCTGSNEKTKANIELAISCFF